MTTDHEDRLRAMLEPDQETWDLSPNDTRAIRWALDELESLRARVAELEAGLAVEPCRHESVTRRLMDGRTVCNLCGEDV